LFIVAGTDVNCAPGIPQTIEYKTADRSPPRKPKGGQIPAFRKKSGILANESVRR
jgi:hypothetical protein